MTTEIGNSFYRNVDVHGSFESGAKSVQAFLTVFSIAFVITALRLWYLYTTDHNLFFDEAQYWLWSKELDFGYYSKPPMLAWTIWLSISLLGDSEFAVRAASPVLHMLTTLVIYLIARKLSSIEAAFFAAITYLFLPAVTLSASLMSTDSVFLFWWAVSFYCFIHAIDKNSVTSWILTGIACGFGMLSKYTMVLFLASAFLYLITSSNKRYILATYKPWLAALLCLLVFSPNILWNYNHGFVSFLHTKDNANLEGELLHPDKFLEFFGAQFGVFGPILFSVLLVMFLRIKHVFKEDVFRLLLLFVIPFLGLISLISLLSRAHANWAAPIYITATIAVILFMLATNKRKLLKASLWLSIAVFTLFLSYNPLVANNIIKLSGVSTDLSLLTIKDPFKRLKGWETLGIESSKLLEEYPEAILLSDERKVIAELVYYIDKHRNFSANFDYAKWNSNQKIQDHYELISDMNQHIGKSFVMITRTSHIENYAPYFSDYKLVKSIVIPAYNDYSIQYQAYLMTDFKGY